MAKSQKSCLVCNEVFATYIKTQRFCSHKCSAIMCPPPLKKKTIKPMQDKQCLQCRNVFLRKYTSGDKAWSLAKYCSMKCLRLFKKRPDIPVCHPDRVMFAKSLCRQCYRQRQEYKTYRKEYRQKPLAREKHLLYMEEYRTKNREKGFFSRLKRLYGLTREEYFNLLNTQNNKCAICFTEKISGKSRLAIDHDHTTGKVRGLLCNQCNRGLGYLRDDITRFRSAIDYLERHSSQGINPAWVGY